MYDVNGTPTDLIDKIENLSVETPDEPLSLGNLPIWMKLSIIVRTVYIVWR